MIYNTSLSRTSESQLPARPPITVTVSFSVCPQTSFIYLTWEMLEMQFLRFTTNLLIQKLWGLEPAICVLTKPLVVSDVLWSLRVTDKILPMHCSFLFPHSWPLMSPFSCSLAAKRLLPFTSSFTSWCWREMG